MPDDARDLRQHQFVILDYPVIDSLPDIGTEGLAVYVLLTKHSHYKTKEAFPSIRQLAALSGLHKNTVKKYIDILEIKGFIRREKHQAPQGDWNNTHYFILPMGGVGQQFTHVGEIVTQGGGSTVHPRGSTDVHELDPYNQIQKEEYYSSSNTRSDLCTHNPPSPQQECAIDAIASAEERKQDTEERLEQTFAKILDSQHLIEPATDPKTLKKSRKAITPINDEEWPDLKNQLANFDLPLEPLNDNEFWNALSHAAPHVVDMEWLRPELAKMWQYFDANPHKRPKSQWKRFVSGWLTRAHEYQRRFEHAKPVPPQHNGYRAHRYQQR